MLDEGADFAPVTAYGRSNVLAEQDMAKLADDSFTPTVPTRNATAYGVSPRLRVDVVVNNLVGYAQTTGEILIQSDGTPWRPLVHVEDIASAFLAVLHAPRELVHDEAFNVGASAENYRIREVAEIVEEVVPGARASFAETADRTSAPDQVDCSKIARVLPEFEPRWTVRSGVEQLYEAASAQRSDLRGVHRHPLPAHQPGARAAGGRPARRCAALADARSPHLDNHCSVIDPEFWRGRRVLVDRPHGIRRRMAHAAAPRAGPRSAAWPPPTTPAVVASPATSDMSTESGNRAIAEGDALGGLDPYSSSKACQELEAASYRDSLMSGDVAVATTRAGNVSGYLLLREANPSPSRVERTCVPTRLAWRCRSALVDCRARETAFGGRGRRGCAAAPRRRTLAVTSRKRECDGARPRTVGRRRTPSALA